MSLPLYWSFTISLLLTSSFDPAAHQPYDIGLQTSQKYSVRALVPPSPPTLHLENPTSIVTTFEQMTALNNRASDHQGCNEISRKLRSVGICMTTKLLVHLARHCYFTLGNSVSFVTHVIKVLFFLLAYYSSYKRQFGMKIDCRLRQVAKRISGLGDVRSLAWPACFPDTRSSLDYGYKPRRLEYSVLP